MATKVTIYLDEELYGKIQKLYKIKNFRTISEFFETAMIEWFERDASEEGSVYMSKQLVSLVESTIRQSEQRINRMLFKLAVSDTELKHIIAAYYSADEDYLKEIHDRSIREVRVTNGLLNVSKMIQEKEDTSWLD